MCELMVNDEMVVCKMNVPAHVSVHVCFCSVQMIL